MIEELKLVNRVPSDAVDKTMFNGNADIDIDTYGFFARSSGEDGFNQNVMKAIMTGLQPDSYGTQLKSLLGKKNLPFIRSRTMLEITNSLVTLRKYQLDYYRQYSDYDSKNVLDAIYEIYVYRTAPTNLVASLKANSLYNKEIQSKKLQEVNDILITA